MNQLLTYIVILLNLMKLQTLQEELINLTLVFLNRYFLIKSNESLCLEVSFVKALTSV